MVMLVSSYSLTTKTPSGAGSVKGDESKILKITYDMKMDTKKNKKATITDKDES